MMIAWLTAVKIEETLIQVISSKKTGEIGRAGLTDCVAVSPKSERRR